MNQQVALEAYRLGDQQADTIRSGCPGRRFSACVLALLLIAGSSLCTARVRAESPAPRPGTVLPDAPQPQPPAQPILPSTGPCQVRNEGATMAASAAARAASIGGYGNLSGALSSPAGFIKAPCPVYVPLINWYARFLNGPQVKPLTPSEKAWLAVRNVTDPFNAVTILGTSAISVGADSHSAYGPGMPGFARSVGVAYAEDMTGEFFGTYLIPSIVHQDPHYHRMPGAPIPRRILHAIVQVGWTEGDNGRGMVNYANFIGDALDDGVANLYVPGRQTDLGASAARYGFTLALTPTDNFISEFLPDVARRIHVRVVIIQRIINQIAKTEP